MKTPFVFLFPVLFACLIFTSYAQAPNAVNYQTVVRNSSGEILSSQNISLRFIVRQGTQTGTSVYQETHALTTNEFGLAKTQIGTGNVVSGNFSAIDWLADDYYLQIELDAGTGYTDMGATQLVSVPYSLASGKSLTATEMSVNDLTDVDGSAATSGQVLKWNGSVWAPANDIGGGTGDNWGTQTVLTDATLSGQGITGNTLKIAQQSATSGQVLKWNGTTWAPADDNSTTYTAGAGIAISGNTITNTGDTDASNDITTSSSAGGDLSGTFPNPSVVKIQGRSVASTAPTSGQVLQWNGTSWTPAAVAGSAGWGLTGNSGTTPGTNFIGTTDNKSLMFHTTAHWVSMLYMIMSQVFPIPQLAMALYKKILPEIPIQPLALLP